MLISFDYEIVLCLSANSPVLFNLFVHPSRQQDILDGAEFSIEPNLPMEEFIDAFGNRSGRLFCPAGSLKFFQKGLIWDSGEFDPYVPHAKQIEVANLPNEVLPFLLPSRYCEVDSELAEFAWSNFGKISPGWARVEAICNFVHHHVKFDYQLARNNRTALETFYERVGVCRDFTHLAVAFCRCLNIPTRYVTGYLGDIRVPLEPYPIDFCAWMEVYLNGQWYAFDPRNNTPRVGRIVVAYGRDASDVAMTTVFCPHYLQKFHVVTIEEENASEEDMKRLQILKNRQMKEENKSELVLTPHS
ncbi:MAG: transglutaminase-like domain-containing protein [Pseudobdellovibrionaceae bacterium]